MDELSLWTMRSLKLIVAACQQPEVPLNHQQNNESYQTDHSDSMCCQSCQSFSCEMINLERGLLFWPDTYEYIVSCHQSKAVGCQSEDICCCYCNDCKIGSYTKIICQQYMSNVILSTITRKHMKILQQLIWFPLLFNLPLIYHPIHCHT